MSEEGEVYEDEDDPAAIGSPCLEQELKCLRPISPSKTACPSEGGPAVYPLGSLCNLRDRATARTDTGCSG